MHKKIRIGFLSFFFIIFIHNAYPSGDNIFIDRMMMSNAALNKKDLNSNYWYFSNTDKHIFYYVNIGIINPTKKQYDVEYICIDKNGNSITQGTLKMNLAELEEWQLGKDTIRRSKLITFTVKPQLHANPKTSLKGDSNYYVKLYVDKKLIGFTEFHYEVW